MQLSFVYESGPNQRYFEPSTSCTETQFIHMKQGVILHANTGFINCIVLCFVVGGGFVRPAQPENQFCLVMIIDAVPTRHRLSSHCILLQMMRERKRPE